MNEQAEYIPAPNCTTPDNIHQLEDAEYPYVARCKVCGQNFYLIAEDLLKELGVLAMERPVKNQ